MLYFEEPDTHSHLYGPDSLISYDGLTRQDKVILYLEVSLREKEFGVVSIGTIESSVANESSIVSTHLKLHRIRSGFRFGPLNARGIF